MVESIDCNSVTVVGNLLKQRVEHMYFPISKGGKAILLDAVHQVFLS